MIAHSPAQPQSGQTLAATVPIPPPATSPAPTNFFPPSTPEEFLWRVGSMLGSKSIPSLFSDVGFRLSPPCYNVNLIHLCFKKILLSTQILSLGDAVGESEKWDFSSTFEMSSLPIQMAGQKEDVCTSPLPSSSLTCCQQVIEQALNVVLGRSNFLAVWLWSPERSPPPDKVPTNPSTTFLVSSHTPLFDETVHTILEAPTDTQLWSATTLTLSCGGSLSRLRDSLSSVFSEDIGHLVIYSQQIEGESATPLSENGGERKRKRQKLGSRSDSYIAMALYNEDASNAARGSCVCWVG